MHMTAKIISPLSRVAIVLFLVGCIPGQNDRPADQVIHPVDTLKVNPARQAIVDSAINLLQAGDLVMRADADYESMSLQNFSQRDKAFSHSGLVFKEAGNWMVYHSIAGHENPAAILRKDSLSSFFNPTRKTAIGVFRYQLSPSEIDSLHRYAEQQWVRKIPFDKHFNLASNDSMYCSEFIYKALQAVTNQRISLHISEITNFRSKQFRQNNKPVYFKRFQYIGLDDLYLHPACREIARLIFP